MDLCACVCEEQAYMSKRSSCCPALFKSVRKISSKCSRQSLLVPPLPSPSPTHTRAYSISLSFASLGPSLTLSCSLSYLSLPPTQHTLSFPLSPSLFSLTVYLFSLALSHFLFPTISLSPVHHLLSLTLARTLSLLLSLFAHSSSLGLYFSVFSLLVLGSSTSVLPACCLSLFFLLSLSFLSCSLSHLLFLTLSLSPVHHLLSISRARSLSLPSPALSLFSLALSLTCFLALSHSLFLSLALSLLSLSIVPLFLFLFHSLSLSHRFLSHTCPALCDDLLHLLRDLFVYSPAKN